MTLAAFNVAVKSGARRSKACEELGVPLRTLQRWRRAPTDGRTLREFEPPNKLSDDEREKVLKKMNEPEFCNLSPKQIVPKLADEGTYLASESTMFRILREEKQLAHRGRAKPPSSRKPLAHVATGPWQVLSWDITYLKSPVTGTFFYLYLIMDVWSRKIVGWAVHEEESAERAAELFKKVAKDAGQTSKKMVLHSDNGSPMRGATMVATLEKLGVQPSFSRPRVSDDNAYSEALFRTCKYRPEYPSLPFADLAAARAWVAAFVAWYNEAHKHSAIGMVTPAERHDGRDVEKLSKRRDVYEEAKRRNPERWSGRTRRWERPEEVRLNAPRLSKKPVKEADIKPFPASAPPVPEVAAA